MPDSFTAGFTVARALLRTGRSYDESVSRFAPYNEVREQNAELVGIAQSSCQSQPARGTNIHLREQQAGRFCGRNDRGGD
jgi:hypothetical protein